MWLDLSGGFLNFAEKRNQMNLPEPFSYEETKRRIEQILEQLQKGGHSLDENLRLFEEGSRHIRECELWLEQARLKVNQVIRNQDGYSLEEFPDRT